MKWSNYLSIWSLLLLLFLLLFNTDRHSQSELIIQFDISLAPSHHLLWTLIHYSTPAIWSRILAFWSGVEYSVLEKEMGGRVSMSVLKSGSVATTTAIADLWLAQQ